jgi:hypothetical protein
LSKDTIDIICYNPELKDGILVNTHNNGIVVIKGSEINLSRTSIDIFKIKNFFSGNNIKIEYEGLLRHKKRTYKIYKVSYYRKGYLQL